MIKFVKKNQKFFSIGCAAPRGSSLILSFCSTFLIRGLFSCDLFLWLMAIRQKGAHGGQNFLKVGKESLITSGNGKSSSGMATKGWRIYRRQTTENYELRNNPVLQLRKYIFPEENGMRTR